MSFSTYSDLQTALASNSNRSDLTSLIPDFIVLAEEEMKRELKISELEATANVTVTDGVGTLPTGYAGARSLYWNGDERTPLDYVTPDRFDLLIASNVSLPKFYTIQENQLKVAAQSTGTVVMRYRARLTALSDSNTTNAMLTLYPDVYFVGALKWLYHHLRNWAAKAEQNTELTRIYASIKKDQAERKYPNSLQVRPR
jgi:hypothetical protein